MKNFDRTIKITLPDTHGARLYAKQLEALIARCASIFADRHHIYGPSFLQLTRDDIKHCIKLKAHRLLYLLENNPDDEEHILDQIIDIINWYCFLGERIESRDYCSNSTSLFV